MRQDGFYWVRDPGRHGYESEGVVVAEQWHGHWSFSGDENLYDEVEVLSDRLVPPS
jgi:hypothetical protein